MKISKIVSGGQTGADIGALDAAIYCGVPHGGWCPKGRRQELGLVIPARYMLREMDSPLFIRRTKANVIDSDATLILTFGPLSGGSLKTRELAEKHSRPCLHIDLSKSTRTETIEVVNTWLATLVLKRSFVLNVAGNRESGAPGLQRIVMLRIIDILIAVNHLPADVLMAGCIT